MLSFLLGLLARPWVLITLVIILGLIAGWFIFGDGIRSWWMGVYKVQEEGRATVVELEEVKQERAVLQEAVREMSKRIKTLTESANAARARAEREASERVQWQRRAQEQDVALVKLDQARRDQPRVRTRHEAYQALKALGY